MLLYFVRVARNRVGLAKLSSTSLTAIVLFAATMPVFRKRCRRTMKTIHFLTILFIPLLCNAAFLEVMQLARLPDLDGNYTDAQTRRKREAEIEQLLCSVRNHLDLDSPELDRRASALRFFLVDDNLKETLEWALSESIERVNAENRELKSKIRQLAILLNHTSALADRLKFEIDHS
jgi:hypothetical protein